MFSVHDSVPATRCVLKGFKGHFKGDVDVLSKWRGQPLSLFLSHCLLSRAKNHYFESQSFVSFISIVSLELLISIPLLPPPSSWVTGSLLQSLVQGKKGVMFLHRIRTENPESHSLCSSVIQSSSRSTRHRCLFSRDTRYFLYLCPSFPSLFYCFCVLFFFYSLESSLFFIYSVPLYQVYSQSVSLAWE